jgi:Flp pilus assembly protein protease CpaA
VVAPEAVLWPVIGVATVAAAVLDLKSKQLPGWLGLGAGVIAVVARLILEGVGDVGHGLLTALLGAVACALPFSVFAGFGRKVGWSDVGLLAAVGAGFGIPRALTAVMLISVVGALAAIVFVVLRRVGSASVTPQDSTGGARDGVDSGRSIPYGVPIAIGAVWAMAWAGPSVGQQDLPDAGLMGADGGAVELEQVEQDAE